MILVCFRRSYGKVKRYRDAKATDYAEYVLIRKHENSSIVMSQGNLVYSLTLQAMDLPPFSLHHTPDFTY